MNLTPGSVSLKASERRLSPRTPPTKGIMSRDEGTRLCDDKQSASRWPGRLFQLVDVATWLAATQRQSLAPWVSEMTDGYGRLAIIAASGRRCQFRRFVASTHIISSATANIRICKAICMLHQSRMPRTYEVSGAFCFQLNKLSAVHCLQFSWLGSRMKNCTRRFFARPAGVRLVSIGLDSP